MPILHVIRITKALARYIHVQGHFCALCKWHKHNIMNFIWRRRGKGLSFHQIKSTGYEPGRCGYNAAQVNIINFYLLKKQRRNEVTKKIKFLIKITHTVNQFDILRDSKRIKYKKTLITGRHSTNRSASMWFHRARDFCEKKILFLVCGFLLLKNTAVGIAQISANKIVARDIYR